ncbi:hypothetical protein [Leptotrichia massiliensis]|uniref:hypothetical protein n=1 Tax=Leptotrichia massiliensis TaxID=1852388 RepID=UPI0028D5E00D|nr:hypothetical protein [Leptotrichia massiliensis]
MKSENIFNKNENKLYTFLGGFLGFIIATVLYFFAIQNNIRHIIVMFLGVGIIDIGVIFGNFFGKKRKEKVKEITDSNEGEKIRKVKKSKFNNLYDELEITIFSVVIIYIFSYLAIYLSEVLNLTLIFKKQYPDTKFFDILMEVMTNIFNIDWARRYLIIYWIFLTISMVMFIIAIFRTRKIKKMKDRNRKAGDLF